MVCIRNLYRHSVGSSPLNPAALGLTVSPQILKSKSPIPMSIGYFSCSLLKHPLVDSYLAQSFKDIVHMVVCGALGVVVT